jgi:tetratricopeptide (TPR) repeat protein
MAIDLRNKNNNINSTKKEIISNNIYSTSKPTKEFIKPILKTNSQNQIDKQKSDINTNNINGIQDKSTSRIKFILVLYSIIFLSITILLIVPEWNSIWHLPKSIFFIFGMVLLLLLSSIFWIFGMIKNTVNITLGDAIFIIIGISIVTISLLNPNQIAFWGSTVRLFDSGVFIGFLILFYIINKFFFEQNSLKIIILFLANLILISSLFSVIAIYIPDLVKSFSIFNTLQPTLSLFAESPQELVFLTLLSINILSIYIFNPNKNTIISWSLKILFYIGIFTHIMLLIRLPGYIMYILTILTLIIHSVNYISKLNKTSNSNNVNIKLIANRLSFIYGIVIIFLLALMIIKPFQNNDKFLQFPLLTIPNFNSSITVARQSLQSDTWLGSGNIMYAWNKFNPISSENQISDFSFETLGSEIFNLITKNGLIVFILLICLGIWIMGSFFRIFFIQKNIPLEAYPLIICLIGIFIIPFTVITKILFILILIMWSNVFTKYFRPLIKFELDINKVPASISSLFTFLILLTIAVSVFATTKLFNVIQSQDNILKASNVTDNQVQKLDFLKQAKNLSPNYIEYANFYIPNLTQEIRQQIVELSSISQQADSKNIISDKQTSIQNNTAKVQELINEYKKTFPSDTRVIYWQLELYSISDQYIEVKEADYLYQISRAKELQPNSLYWDLYEAQYYTRQAQKDKELNIDKVNQSKSILNSILEKNIYFIDGYKNYYNVLSLSKDYPEQINILNKYINAIVDKNLIADQNLVYDLALAYQNNKQYDEAISYYTKLLESFPNYTNVYFNLGEIYEVQKKIDLAIQQYQKVLELDSTAEIARKKIEQLK